MKVLYIGHDNENPSDYCPGSVLCMSCVQKLSNTKIRIQDTSVLRKHAQLPEWLNGTPILIDDRDANPLRGIQAYRFLQKMVIEEKRVERTPPSRTETNHRKKQNPETQPRMQPAVTRQTNDEEAMFAHMNEPEPDDEMQDATENGTIASQMSSSDKVTDADLQRFMAQRNASPASANNATPTA